MGAPCRAEPILFPVPPRHSPSQCKPWRWVPSTEHEHRAPSNEHKHQVPSMSTSIEHEHQWVCVCNLLGSCSQPSLPSLGTGLWEARPPPSRGGPRSQRRSPTQGCLSTQDTYLRTRPPKTFSGHCQRGHQRSDRTPWSHSDVRVQQETLHREELK